MKSKYSILTTAVLALMIVGMAVSLASAATGAFSLSVTSGFAGTVTKASAGTNSGWHGGATVTLKWDDGVTVLGSTTANSGNGKWSLDITVPSSATAGTHTISADDAQGTTGTATFTVTVSAVTMTVSYHVNDGTSPSAAPVFHYKDTNGASKTYALTGSAHAVTGVGAGLAWSVDSPIGSASEQWATTTASGNAPASGSSTTVFNYYHQYMVTFQYSFANTAGSGYSNPVVSYIQFGTSGHTLTALQASGPSDWVDAGSSVTYPATLTGSGTSEQWVTQTTSITAALGTATTAYNHQLKVTFDASTNVKVDSTATIVTVAGSAKAAGALPFTSDWINSGDTLTYSYQNTVAPSSSPSTQYLWNSTSGLSQTSQATTFTVTTSGTITAYFQAQTQDTQTQISIMYTPSSANPAEAITISGKLTSASDPTVGVPDREVTLSYFDGENWNNITTTTTDTDGSYSFNWTLPADMPTGTHLVKAVFNGDPDEASPQYIGSESISSGIGLLVLPEYSLGGIVAFAMCFGAFAVFRIRKNRQPKKSTIK